MSLDQDTLDAFVNNATTKQLCKQLEDAILKIKTVALDDLKRIRTGGNADDIKVVAQEYHVAKLAIVLAEHALRFAYENKPASN